MSTIWEPQPIQVYQNWVEVIEDEAYEKLNEWERNFIGSIKHKLDQGFQLSKNQADKLESIYAEKTS